MKKLVSLLLTLMLVMNTAVFALAQSEPVAITFWHSMSDTAGTLIDQIVAEFNAGAGKEKGITVEAVFQGKYSDATTKLNSVLSAQSYADLPDVMNLDATGKVPYANSGVAYTVDDALLTDGAYDTGRILSSAMVNWNYAGVQLGMPFAASTTVMFYNKTLLDSVGAAVPQTFADIVALDALLPDTTAAGTELVTYCAIPNTPTLANWLGQIGSYVVNNANGSEGNATELACIDNGALSVFLTEWKTMFEAGALNNTSTYGSDAFIAGQLAIYTTSSSNVTSLIQKVGDGFELGVSNYPKVNAEASLGATVSGSCVVMFDKGDDAKKAAAWEFVKYLASADVQAVWAAGTGYTPINLDASEVESYKNLLAEYPQYAVAIDQLNATPAEMRSVTIGPAIDFYYAIQDDITAMLDEGWTVEETVSVLAEDLQGLLDQYNAANQ